MTDRTPDSGSVPTGNDRGSSAPEPRSDTSNRNNSNNNQNDDGSGSSADSNNNTGDPNRRRRGSRGGRNRRRGSGGGGGGGDNQGASGSDTNSADKPKIGDSRPAPAAASNQGGNNQGGRNQGNRNQGGNNRGNQGDGNQGGRNQGGNNQGEGGEKRKRRRRRGKGGGGGNANSGNANSGNANSGNANSRNANSGNGGGGGRRSNRNDPVQAVTTDTPIELDEETLQSRRGQERKGRPVGRYLMAVHVEESATQISILEGRSLIEHYVSHPADDVSQIHGNIYLGRVQNVLPGMEAAFIDIGTPKNAVLYRGDVVWDKDSVEGKRSGPPKIEQVLKNRQSILCQVTKNPIAHKGARLTQEVSLPGRFVVLVPNSKTYGISKRLPDKERKRLRAILDGAKPKQHGVIVRTAAENVTAEEIEADVRRLLSQWEQIEQLAKSAKAPTLLYREPEMAVRIIREEFSKDYRSVIIDDKALFDEINDYVTSITPALADRLQYHDKASEKVSLFERHHVHEQLIKAVDTKVWLPSGGSLIIEHTEALTVIDVNTGKNVGKSSLEETVFRNNLEAAKEVARQLRLRDIGGIIVIDFVDMEEKRNRDEVIKVFRDALSRDKTRTQAFDITELGLVQMTRKRIGEGLIESLSHRCEDCEGRGIQLDPALVGEI